MRVTGGKYVRRTVACPPGLIRPAMDRMRESVFAILGPLDGLRFLDLFSGSGIVALEALSRGAASADLVEQDVGKRAVLQHNLSFVQEPWTLHLRSVEAFLRNATDTWDLVFVDPPFAYPKKVHILQIIQDRKLLARSGRILLHHPSAEKLDFSQLQFIISDRRKYGGSEVIFFVDSSK